MSSVTKREQPYIMKHANDSMLVSVRLLLLNEISFLTFSLAMLAENISLGVLAQL